MGYFDIAKARLDGYRDAMTCERGTQTDS